MPKNSLPAIAEDSPYLIDEVGPDAEIETAIEALGNSSVQSPLLKKNYPCFVSEQDRVLVKVSHESLKKIFKEGDYDLLIFLATDIIKRGSEVLFWEKDNYMEKTFNKKAENNSFYLEGVMSRKKQIIPPLTKTFLKK